VKLETGLYKTLGRRDRPSFPRNCIWDYVH